MSDTNVLNEVVTKRYWIKTKTGSGLLIVVDDLIYKAPRRLSKWKGRPLTTVTTILKNKRELIELQELKSEDISTYVDGTVSDGDNI